MAKAKTHGPGHWLHYKPCFDHVTNSRNWKREHLIQLDKPIGQYHAKIHDTCAACRNTIRPGDLAQKVTLDAPVLE